MLLFACRNPSVFARCAFWLVVLVPLAGALPRLRRQETGGCEPANGLAVTAEKPASARLASTPAAHSDASKKLLEEFQRLYALPDTEQVVKRVAPPFFAGTIGILSRTRRRAGENHSRRPGDHDVQVGPAKAQTASNELASLSRR